MNTFYLNKIRIKEHKNIIIKLSGNLHILEIGKIEKKEDRSRLTLKNRNSLIGTI